MMAMCPSRSLPWVSPRASDRRARSTVSTCRSTPARSTDFSGRTARARPRPSVSCSACCAPTPGRSICSGSDPWRDAVELHRRLAYVPGEVSLWPEPDRRGGDRPVRSACGATSTSAAATSFWNGFSSTRPRRPAPIRKGNRQKVALVAALASKRRAAPARRTDLGTRPADGGGIPGLHPRGEGRGANGAALQPHPGRGRSAVRPAEHHQAGPGTSERGTLDELRHLTRTSITAETSRPADGLADLDGVHDLEIDGTHVRFEVDTDHLDVAVRRLGEFGVRSLVSHPPTLEELFLRHYGDELAQGTRTCRRGGRRDSPAAAMTVADGNR